LFAHRRIKSIQFKFIYENSKKREVWSVPGKRKMTTKMTLIGAVCGLPLLQCSHFESDEQLIRVIRVTGRPLHPMEVKSSTSYKYTDASPLANAKTLLSGEKRVDRIHFLLSRAIFEQRKKTKVSCEIVV
jgi:hypothetical protein